ncbi:hypothetical protein GXW77_15860 [Roseomonas alkaliterrae]|uniref:PEGA domain-containing protein n=1 Tax=Neoroseomonas alkaliterrae TaxID=1452450 RepID=A0A840Y191_9PROT|nr:hypothetical protein [Neoroseomonas alkaliterrae]MBB5688402.1 hypothetical protein [Neoroseomonas alkaliterrae]MBR0677652.1 hypothetical protein [Neoroseomonas alkaliterrae]
MKRLLVVALAALGLPACSTITAGPSQAILVATDPPGARCEVKRRGVVIGTIEQTPGTVAVRKSPYDIAIECTRPGYYPGAAVVERRFDDTTLGNMLIGGLIGLTVDASTGAWNEYPRSVRIRMRPRFQDFAADTTTPAGRIAAVERRTEAQLLAARRGCARQSAEACIARIEAIENRRTIEREVIVAQQRLADPSSAVPPL